MRIAVATSDGVHLSMHFGRSAGFIIYEVEGTAFQRQELRSNHHTPHAQGLCDGNHGHGSHSHSNILQLLGDCQEVLCGGMGAGAANALSENGIRPHVLPEPCSADEALQKFLSGDVSAEHSVLCDCHH